MLLFAMPATGAGPLVAAASSLRSALEEVVDGFHANDRSEVRLVFGSSGNLYRQIRQGAPFGVFMSADKALVDKLEASGLTVGESYRYGLGQLVYFAPHGSVLDPAGGLEDLRQAFLTDRIGRFAIANPDHAPYGRAAMAILRRLEVEELAATRLILGENVAQTAQFVLSGSIDGGLLAYSLIASANVAARGTFSAVPAALHAPVEHDAVLLSAADEVASRFFEYLKSDAAGKVFARYGLGR